MTHTFRSPISRLATPFILALAACGGAPEPAPVAGEPETAEESDALSAAPVEETVENVARDASTIVLDHPASPARDGADLGLSCSEQQYVVEDCATVTVWCDSPTEWHLEAALDCDTDGGAHLEGTVRFDRLGTTDWKVSFEQLVASSLHTEEGEEDYVESEIVLDGAAHAWREQGQGWLLQLGDPDSGAPMHAGGFVESAIVEESCADNPACVYQEIVRIAVDFEVSSSPLVSNRQGDTLTVDGSLSFDGTFGYTYTRYRNADSVPLVLELEQDYASTLAIESLAWDLSPPTCTCPTSGGLRNTQSILLDPQTQDSCGELHIEFARADGEACGSSQATLASASEFCQAQAQRIEDAINERCLAVYAP